MESAAAVAGVKWVHAPIEPISNAGKAVSTADHESFRKVGEVLALSGAGLRVVVHCQAGCHRAGIFCYVLLRSAGFSPEDAMSAIRQTREITWSELTARTRKRPTGLGEKAEGIVTVLQRAALASSAGRHQPQTEPPLVAVHFAAARIQRSWKISRRRRRFVGAEIATLRQLWRQSHNRLYGAELATLRQLPASRHGGYDVAPLGEALEEPIQRQHQQLVAQEKVPVLLQQMREEDVADEVTGEEGSPEFRYFTAHFPCLRGTPDMQKVGIQVEVFEIGPPSIGEVALNGAVASPSTMRAVS